MSDKPIDMATIRQFLEAQDYSIDAPNPKERRPVWRVSKYSVGDYYTTQVTEKGAYASALNHFLCDYMGRCWIRISENMLMFKALAKLDDSQYEILEGAVFYFKQLHDAILGGDA